MADSNNVLVFKFSKVMVYRRRKGLYIFSLRVELIGKTKFKQSVGFERLSPHRYRYRLFEILHTDTDYPYILIPIPIIGIGLNRLFCKIIEPYFRKFWNHYFIFWNQIFHIFHKKFHIFNQIHILKINQNFRFWNSKVVIFNRVLKNWILWNYKENFYIKQKIIIGRFESRQIPSIKNDWFLHVFHLDQKLFLA